MRLMIKMNPRLRHILHRAGILWRSIAVGTYCTVRYFNGLIVAKLWLDVNDFAAFVDEDKTLDLRLLLTFVSKPGFKLMVWQLFDAGRIKNDISRLSRDGFFQAFFEGINLIREGGFDFVDGAPIQENVCSVSGIGFRNKFNFVTGGGKNLGHASLVRPGVGVGRNSDFTSLRISHCGKVYQIFAFLSRA